MYCTKIELAKENMSFSAGHFTIFSATERENFHGHNFRVKADFILNILCNGMAANYDVFKNEIVQICQRLNEHFIIPAQSKHLIIRETEKEISVTFNNETFSFLHRDVLILPIENASLEEFSRYICEELLKKRDLIKDYQVLKIRIKTSSESGQWADYESEDLSSI